MMLITNSTISFVIIVTKMMHRHPFVFVELQWWRTDIQVFHSDELKSASLRALDVICRMQQCNTTFLDDGLLSCIFSYLIILYVPIQQTLGMLLTLTFICIAPRPDLLTHPLGAHTHTHTHYDSCFLKNLQYKIHV